jgi:hypothetical protein
MELREIKPTAEVTFLLDKGAAPAVPIMFTVKFVPGDAADDHIKRPRRIKDGEGKPVLVPQENRIGDIFRGILIDAVVGWDLTTDGQPIPCTMEKKREILPTLLGMMVKSSAEVDENDPFGRVLGRSLLAFAMDAENFLKN